MSESEERIDHYLKIVAINKIKAVIKTKLVKVFPEYDEEVDDYLRIAKERYIEEFVGVWV
jgi:hypothetical protein